MKNINFKHLMALLIVCGLLSACGKNKKEAAAAPVAPVVNVATGTYQNVGNMVSFSTFEGFKSAVNAEQFVPMVGFHEVYKYATCTTSTGTFLGFIPTSSSSCSNSFEVNAMGGNVTGSSYGANEAAIKTQLKAIVNASTGASNSYQILSATSVQFVSGSYIYMFNLGYPAAANPVSRRPVSGGSGSYYLYDVNSFSF